MSYRLTLKAFKQEQEDQNTAIQALNDRVQKLEIDVFGDGSGEETPAPATGFPARTGVFVLVVFLAALAIGWLLPALLSKVF